MNYGFNRYKGYNGYNVLYPPIVFLFFFTCSIVLIFAIIQKVNPDSILLLKDETSTRNSSNSATNYNLEMNVTAI